MFIGFTVAAIVGGVIGGSVLGDVVGAVSSAVAGGMIGFWAWYYWERWRSRSSQVKRESKITQNGVSNTNRAYASITHIAVSNSNSYIAVSNTNSSMVVINGRVITNDVIK